MKKTFTIIIALMAIALSSVTSSAQKFVFNFSEYYFRPNVSELGTPRIAESHVTVNKKTGEVYSIVITSDILTTRTFDNVKFVDCIEGDDGVKIVFALNGTHYLLISYMEEDQYGGALELDPENTEDNTVLSLFANDIEDNAAQSAFLREFKRLKDCVTANNKVVKTKVKNSDAKPITPVATPATSHASKAMNMPLRQLLTHIADYGEFGLPIQTVYRNMASAGLKTRYEEDKSVFAAFCTPNCGMANDLKNDIELYIDGLSHQYTQSSVTYGCSEQDKKTLLYMFWFENSPGSTHEADAFLTSLIAELNKLGYNFDPKKIDSTQASHTDKYKNVTIWRTYYTDQKNQLIYGGALYVFE